MILCILTVTQVKMKCNVGFLFAVAFLVGVYAIPTPEGIDFHAHAETSGENRIVSGAVAPDGSAPYMAALSTGWAFRSFVCGGSLISERFVLTAAHCIDSLYSFGSLSRSLRVTVGTNHWNRGGQWYNVARNVTHQHYLSSIIKNDIGLLVTRSRVTSSERVAPLALSFDFIGAGVAARANGWGRTEYMGPISDNLLELKVETIGGEQCVKEMARRAAELGVTAPPVDPKTELCTLHSPGHGMCNGDSGSALVQLDSWQQIGVVSWGLPCARGAPDVFLRLSAFSDWILQNVHV